MKKRSRRSITDLTPEELTAAVIKLEYPAYRTKQLTGRVFRNLAMSWDEITEIPRAFRESLSALHPLHGIELVTSQVSSDKTIKGLFQLNDGHTIEAALMPGQRSGKSGVKGTVCVSTQVGCAVGCPFCATSRHGFKRNLSSGEMIDQVLYFARLLRDSNAESAVSNIVFMGMGEPLANYDALLKTIRVLNSPDGLNIGARSMTVSTAGMIPGIHKLASEKLQVGLAVSLHAGTDALRNRLVPLNKKYPFAELLSACQEYFDLTGRRVSYEYVLFRGVNDSLSEARSLGRLLKDQNCHVNLIPANKTGREDYQAPSHGEVLAFMTELKKNHVNVTIRRSRGQDIDAGCGQLRSRHEHGALKQQG